MDLFNYHPPSSLANFSVIVFDFFQFTIFQIPLPDTIKFFLEKTWQLTKERVFVFFSTIGFPIN